MQTILPGTNTKLTTGAKKHSCSLLWLTMVWCYGLKNMSTLYLYYSITLVKCKIN